MTNTGYTPEEPIAAIATALAPGAIGIVRASGKNCIELAAKFFSRPKALLSAAPNTIVYGWIKDPARAEQDCRVDEVMAASKVSEIFSSSSGYSISTSIEASVSTTSFFTDAISEVSVPESLAAAFVREMSVLLSIISRTASARVKSVRPLIYALNVNSPRSARRKPFRRKRAKTALTTETPP